MHDTSSYIAGLVLSKSDSKASNGDLKAIGTRFASLKREAGELHSLYVFHPLKCNACKTARPARPVTRQGSGRMSERGVDNVLARHFSSEKRTRFDL
jgi:hypothetical protein